MLCKGMPHNDSPFLTSQLCVDVNINALPPIVPELALDGSHCMQIQTPSLNMHGPNPGLNINTSTGPTYNLADNKAR